MTNGDSAVRIVSDLVLTMEREVSDATHSTDGAEPGVEIYHNTEEICIFDELTKLMNLAENMERADEEWYTNHFSAAMGRDPYLSDLSDKREFY
ncbi:hypothetical protein BWQ96_10573 [Gracilariopsis chorda]|uniref:Uncharacterized protein n=1 Tax=Gracilariopsis chorda TaxID=448386 RepID=A0A2V3ICA2_9FLOR|nr:hypothetical protein BWQ96_10573 [Gracilariopsis chorda]|eukprot:PXF39724.1 hypothetical protein BWQ96_10573 [Gracilariopsis chorda]